MALQINLSLCSALITCDWVLVVDVCPDLINVGLGAHHPVEGKIYQILPVYLLLGDAIPSWTLATSMALVNKLSNLPIAGDYVRKFPLLPELLQHR